MSLKGFQVRLCKESDLVDALNIKKSMLGYKSDTIWYKTGIKQFYFNKFLILDEVRYKDNI